MFGLRVPLAVQNDDGQCRFEHLIAVLFEHRESCFTLLHLLFRISRLIVVENHANGLAPIVSRIILEGDQITDLEALPLDDLAIFDVCLYVVGENLDLHISILIFLFKVTMFLPRLILLQYLCPVSKDLQNMPVQLV